MALAVHHVDRRDPITAPNRSLVNPLAVLATHRTVRNVLALPIGLIDLISRNSLTSHTNQTNRMAPSIHKKVRSSVKEEKAENPRAQLMCL